MVGCVGGVLVLVLVCGRGGGANDAVFKGRVGGYDVAPAFILHFCIFDEDADFGCCGVDGAEVESV